MLYVTTAPRYVVNRHFAWHLHESRLVFGIFVCNYRHSHSHFVFAACSSYMHKSQDFIDPVLCNIQPLQINNTPSRVLMCQNLSNSKSKDMNPLPRPLKPLASSVLPSHFLFANTLRPSTLLAAATNHNGPREHGCHRHGVIQIQILMRLDFM
jgi:hypothetical protein